MQIPVILGTARKGRFSEKAAKFIINEVKNCGIKTELIDVIDYRLNATDNSEKSVKAKKLLSKVSSADALIIVSPEYNHGYPGELKMMLDLLNRQDYAMKPVGICGVSSGSYGGSRMIEQLKLVCVELMMIPIRDSVFFCNVEELFEENGKIKDDSYHSRAKKFIDSLVSYVNQLKK